MIWLLSYPSLLMLCVVQITMTASTLLEAAEPSVLWKHLLKGILNAIDSTEQQLEVFYKDISTPLH